MSDYLDLSVMFDRAPADASPLASLRARVHDDGRVTLVDVPFWVTDAALEHVEDAARHMAGAAIPVRALYYGDESPVRAVWNESWREPVGGPL